MDKNQCVFCAIVAGLVPASIRYETSDVIAFDPLDPVAAGHVVVIPKCHFENLFDISSQALSAVMEGAREISCRLAAQPEITGVNMLHASGTGAQQSVPHFHIHLVPRREDDGLDLWIKQSL